MRKPGVVQLDFLKQIDDRSITMIEHWFDYPFSSVSYYWGTEISPRLFHLALTVEEERILHSLVMVEDTDLPLFGAVPSGCIIHHARHTGKAPVKVERLMYIEVGDAQVVSQSDLNTFLEQALNPAMTSAIGKYPACVVRDASGFRVYYWDAALGQVTGVDCENVENVSRGLGYGKIGDSDSNGWINCDLIGTSGSDRLFAITLSAAGKKHLEKWSPAGN